MDNTVLALFDPIFDEQFSHEKPSSAPTSGHNMVVDSLPTQSSQGDASIASHQAQQAQITTSLESHPSKQHQAPTPSQSTRIVNERPGTYGHDTMYTSQVPPVRSKPKPFGSRRLPIATAPRQSDRNIASVPPYQYHIPTARSVSLPNKPTSYDRLNYAAGRPRVVMLGAVHTNRVVSLPEVAILTNRLSGVAHSHLSTLPTVDELQPLIDLTSPHRTLVDDIPPQPAVSSAAPLVHSSFSNSSEDGPSPPSSPELSETDVLVGSPTTGRSVNFLRNLAHSTSKTDSPDPAPGTPRTTKSTTQNKSQANSNTQMEPPNAKPIPALHGPPSLPYARCPSGAEGIMISEQASLPRMIWGLHEQPPGTPKTPGAHRVPLTDPQSSNYSAPETPLYTAAADTPASTVVATPESAKFGAVWQHPKLSYKSSAPYAKFQRSMQAGPLVETGPDRFIHSDGHTKLPSSSGRENTLLQSPFLLGDEQFETPGGYTEYHYVNEDNSTANWQEFVPISHRNPSEHATSATHHAARTLSLGSASLDAPAYLKPGRIDLNSNTDGENAPLSQTIDDVKKISALDEPGSLPSEVWQALDSRTDSIRNSIELATTPSIFAVRKALRSQPHRPKLRDHPALTELLSSQSLRADSDRPTGLTIPPPLDIGKLALSLGVAPEALADSIQKLRTQKFPEPATHTNSSQPFALVAAHDSNACPPSNPEEPALPPGIKIPERLLAGSSGTNIAFSNESLDDKPLHPSGALRNPRSIPLTRLRNRNQHRLTSELNKSSVPLPITNDLEAGLPSGPFAKTSNILESTHDTERGAVRDVAGGRVVMGAGIQAQGPSMLSGFAAKQKNISTGKGSSTADTSQASFSKRSNRAPTPRSRPNKESSLMQSSGARGDSNSPITRHNKSKKAGSRLSRAKTNSVNAKTTDTSPDPTQHLS